MVLHTFDLVMREEREDKSRQISESEANLDRRVPGQIGLSIYSETLSQKQTTATEKGSPGEASLSFLLCSKSSNYSLRKASLSKVPAGPFIVERSHSGPWRTGWEDRDFLDDSTLDSWGKGQGSLTWSRRSSRGRPEVP